MLILNSETEVWLDFSLACEYITETEYIEMYAEAEEIGRLLSYRDCKINCVKS